MSSPQTTRVFLLPLYPNASAAPTALIAPTLPAREATELALAAPPTRAPAAAGRPPRRYGIVDAERASLSATALLRRADASWQRPQYNSTSSASSGGYSDDDWPEDAEDAAVATPAARPFGSARELVADALAPGRAPPVGGAADERPAAPPPPPPAPPAAERPLPRPW